MAAWMQRVGGLLAAAAVVTTSAASRAQVARRFVVDQRGDFVLIGNTLARDCAADPEQVLVGSVGDCGDSSEDSGADVFWSVGADGAAPVANASVVPEEAASIAALALPAGAGVTRAELYWSAQAGGGDPTVATFGRGAAAASVSATRTVRSDADGDGYYQSVADVTDLVRELGSGQYIVGGIDAASPVGREDTTYYAGWWLLVFYQLDSEPLRHLALYDGFALVTDVAPSDVALTGFEVPPEGADAKLGVVAFDGDATADGDELRFGAAAPLGAGARLDASDNFFDSSRRDTSGEPFGATGDRPRASGEAGSMSGIDLHVVDVSGSLEPGQTSAEVLAMTTADRYFLSGLVFSVATAAFDLSGSSQSVRDVDGPPLRPGDELEYTVVVDNVGAGVAPIVTLRAPLPAQVTYVPGSLEIAEGVDPGPLTDAIDTDRGELSPGAEPALVVRLGAGADGSNGGSLASGESSTVRFRVALDPAASGSIVGQAQVGAAREPGAAVVSALTDGNLALRGPNPTEIAVDDCAGDADCSPGFCDLAQNPPRCIACLDDSACPGLAPSCDGSGACVCVPAAAEMLCDGKDDDCDGEIDEGLAGEPCNAGNAECQLPGVSACDGAGVVRCEPTGPVPSEQCTNDSDDDCDGASDADDADCAPASNGGASASSGDGLEPGSSAPPTDPRAGASSTPLRGSPRSGGDTPSAAALGGGGGCQLPLGVRGSAAPWLWVGALALLVRRSRARAVARRR